jgi:3-keto-5-aminohexanoate cleavage enzyme
MNKMIITATTANSWIHPDVKNWAETDDDLINDAVECAEAGAAILHVHLPRSSEAKYIVDKIRARTDAIVQAGMSSFPIEERQTDFDCRPDMLSIILNHHAEEFTAVTVDKLHPLTELEAYAVKCAKYNIKPEWEVWHTGSYWNLNWMIKKGLIKAPHIITMFFGWPGGTWCPPEIESYQYLMRFKPEGCLHTVSTMGEDQTKMATLAISTGGNIRIGTEDNPFMEDGRPARCNAELIDRAVWLSRKMGRPVAIPAEARKLTGVGK